jgi:hypothetical protein
MNIQRFPTHSWEMFDLKSIGGFVFQTSGLGVLLSMLLAFAALPPEIMSAKDKELNPEKIIIGHLKALGSPDVLAGIKSRGMGGSTSANFILGGTGKMAGQSFFISSGSNVAVILKYGALEYPGEYFAYNGDDVTVGTISPGQRSPLGDFLYRYRGILKEGLLGGVITTNWALLDTAQRKPTLKYDEANIDGRKLIQLEYIPQKNTNGMKIKLYFDPATFRHVRSEYRVKISGEQALQSDVPITRKGNTRNAGILDPVRDSEYKLTEKFEDFKEIEGITLPQAYTLEYSVEGIGSTFLANWTAQAEKWVHNGKIDPSIFKAQQ